MSGRETIITNQDIAVLIRVNDLAMRWGMSPGDFDAYLEPSDQGNIATLRYDTRPSNEAGREAFSRMLEVLGAAKDNWEISGTVSEIIGALDRAMLRSPSPRTR